MYRHSTGADKKCAGEVEQMLCTGTVLEQTRNAHRILRVNNEVRK